MKSLLFFLKKIYYRIERIIALRSFAEKHGIEKIYYRIESTSDFPQKNNIDIDMKIYYRIESIIYVCRQ